MAAILLAVSGCSPNNGNTPEGSQSDESQNTSRTEAEIQGDILQWDELDQKEITAAMGMGWNLGNQLKASNSGIPSETAWG